MMAYRPRLYQVADNALQRLSGWLGPLLLMKWSTLVCLGGFHMLPVVALALVYRDPAVEKPDSFTLALVMVSVLWGTILMIASVLKTYQQLRIDPKLLTPEEHAKIFKDYVDRDAR